MITEDQSEVIAFLASPSTHGGNAVGRIETHASIVFLAGDRALKLKRAVKYDYLDFSTAARRRVMCEAELRVNRRTAPSLYRGVVAVTREPSGALALGGPGTPVEWLVDMARFDEDGLLDRLASRHALDISLMRPLAAAIARLHDVAAVRSDHGGRAGMAWVVDGNAAGFAQEGSGVLDLATCDRVWRTGRRALERHGARLDWRREHGFVRECHGDLHLRNVVLIDGRPTIFDGVEFNDEIACIDVLYDLAFLLMDLWHVGLHAHANAVWNAYLAGMKTETDAARDGIALMPLFLSCRAAVRAKTSVTAARLQDDVSRRRELEARAREYLAMADALGTPPAPGLLAIGGLSGSGKTTVAYELAPSVGPVPGAVVIRSDEIRKGLCGVSPLARLGPEGYTPEVSRRVYAAVAESAAAIARAGHSAIADAVFARDSDRRAIEAAAAAAGVPFLGLWLDAPEQVLIDRVTRRSADASDADAAVVRLQRSQDVGVVTWPRVDASRDLADVVRDAVAHVNVGFQRARKTA